VISAPWVRGDVPAWLADPRFEDHDLLLAADEATAAGLTRRSGKPVTLLPWEPGAPLNAAPVRDALNRWGRARKVAIHIGPRTWDESARWGDKPFARGIQAEFERRGWPATVHVVEDRESAPAVRADVSLHILGGRIPDVRAGQTSILWVISHPDRVSVGLCDAYDTVFVASDLFAAQLAERTSTPVVPLHQATDPVRFFPDPTGPHHELLFVGNSRGQHRPIIDALAATKHELAVYGTSWSADLLDPRFLCGEWIPNADLHRYYSSADIVLNDHWRDMRDEGFISNRAYDALASGAFVLSDDVPGLDREFDGAIGIYQQEADLDDQIEHFLANPEERRDRASRGRAAVLARHTFGHRVETILEVVAGLQRATPRPVTRPEVGAVGVTRPDATGHAVGSGRSPKGEGVVGRTVRRLRER
jgi:Glycosyl transferases group 1